MNWGISITGVNIINGDVKCNEQLTAKGMTIGEKGLP